MKRLCTILLLVLAPALPALAASFDMEVLSAPGHFYLGEGDVVIPLRMTGIHSGNYRFSVTGPSWLSASQAETSAWYWEANQAYWAELSGTPESTGSFSGTVNACDDNGCVQKTFSFSVLASTRAGGVWAYSWDAAASYDRQVELRTQFKNATESDFRIPAGSHYDYYLTMTSLTKEPMFDIWWTPDASDICLEIRDCGSRRYIMRHRFRKSSTIAAGRYFPVTWTGTGVQTSYQQKDVEHLGEPTVYISDKILSTSPRYNTYHEAGTNDWSDPMDSAYYESLARLRHPQVNDHITFYAGDSLVSGEAPEWAADASCPLLSLENGDFLTSTGRDTTYHFCTSADLNTAPAVTFDTPADTIYTGEDYVAFPVITDAEGDSVTLSMDYSGSTATWFEVGTPANYLELSDWPHPNNRSLYYVRSSYQEVRQKQLEIPGTYHYNLVATDKLGASDTVSRTVVVLPVSAHPSASGKSLAVLAGDETWFLKYQLDVATGIVNFSGSAIVLENYHYEWYGTKAETATVHPNAWYSNGGFTPTYTDCGNGHYRIRYTYAGKDTIWGGYSFFDNKYGLVYGTTVRMNKLDDYSMFPFAGDTLRRRRYDPDVTLYNGDGTLLWGNAPAWAGDCPEGGASSSSSQTSSSSAVPGSSSSGTVSSSSVVSSSSMVFISSSSVTVSSSSAVSVIPELSVLFKDGNVYSGALPFYFSIWNKGAESVPLKGYTLYFYYNQNDSLPDPDTLAVSNYGGANASYVMERCAEDLYRLAFSFGSTSVAASDTGAEVTGLLSVGGNWNTSIGKSLFASWMDVSEYAENPDMALLDASGNLVYGRESWACNGYKKFKISVYASKMEPVTVGGINSSGLGVAPSIKNEGDSALAGPYYVAFYVTLMAGQVPVLFSGKDTLSVSNNGLYLRDDGVNVLRTSIGDRHTFLFAVPGTLQPGASKTVSFNLYDACLFDCGDTDVAKSSFRWDASDDWSATVKSGKTEYVTVHSAEGKLLYGNSDPSAPSFDVALVAASGNSSVLPSHPRAVAGAQNPNRTDAVAYSGGQLLSGGDFENPSLLGWAVTSDSVYSVRGPAPQGSRYLKLVNGGIRQKLPGEASALLADSGAVLTLWHKGYVGVTFLENFDYRDVPYSSSWKVDTLHFASSKFSGSGEYTLQLSGTALVDDAELVPGTRAAPSTYAVRFTTTQHEELETRAYDGDKELLITSSQRDGMGKPWKKFLPFALPCAGALDCNSEGKTLRNPSMANSYYVLANPDYPDAQGYPYAETSWKPDQAATKDVIGNPGKAFSLAGDGLGTHLVRAYSSGVNLSGIDLLDSADLSSAVSAVRGARAYDGGAAYHAAKDGDPTHLWELSVDQDGRRAFTVKDGEGRVIVSGALDSSGNLLSRSVNELDSRGNVIRSHPPVSCEYTPTPAHCVTPSTFEYDSESRVIASTEPDAGETRSYYDPAGRLRATQTQRQIDSGTATVTVYDGLDRAVATGEWRHGMTETQLRNYFKDMTHRFDPALSALDSATLTRNFYDRMPGRDSVLTALGVQLYPAGLTADSFRYTKTRLVATVSRFRDADGPLKGHSVAYRHDKKGRVIASYVYNGGVAADSLKLLATETEYDLAGKVLRVTKYPYGLSAAGKARSIAERYTYDRLGRVDTLYVKDGAGSETVLAAYEYYPTGSVKRIALGGGTLSLDYTYHISGAVKSAAATRTDDGATLYSETLYYEDCGGAGCTPQYNGNVSRMAHSLAHGNTGYGQERDVSYAYDLMNRLTKVDDADMDGFDETFAYDPQGRITAQRRGADAANAAGGEYDYYANTDKLKKAAAGMSAAVDAERLMNADSNFVYDADGNMTYDASKKMTVSYDYRGLPTEFRKAEADGDSTRLVMAYDGSGARIMKRRDRRTAGGTEWITELTTHYTGIGSEIRESGLDGTAKVVVNLPQGLGRYGVENATAASAATPGFAWYLKNPLGSTMLVYGTGSGSGSVKAAYDYRAFGEQVDLTVPADKVTENFTWKELDDETALGYWGARYMDQMLGLWVSADAKRQFSSPYL